jgi:hypothetical protein
MLSGYQSYMCAISKSQFGQGRVVDRRIPFATKFPRLDYINTKNAVSENTLKTTAAVKSESYARTWPICWPAALAAAVATGSTLSQCSATNHKAIPSFVRRPSDETTAAALRAIDLGICY